MALQYLSSVVPSLQSNPVTEPLSNVNSFWCLHLLILCSHSLTLCGDSLWLFCVIPPAITVCTLCGLCQTCVMVLKFASLLAYVVSLLVSRRCSAHSSCVALWLWPTLLVHILCFCTNSVICGHSTCLCCICPLFFSRRWFCFTPNLPLPALWTLCFFFSILFHTINLRTVVTCPL